MEETKEKPQISIQNLVSIDQYADLTKKSRRTIYNWIKEGKVDTIEFMGRQYLDKTKLLLQKD